MRAPARSITPLLVLALALGGLTAGCGTGSDGSATPANGSGPLTPASAPATSASAAAQPAPAIDAWLVVGRTGEPDLHVLLASTGEELMRLPEGVPDATWGHLVTTSTDGGRTRIRDITVQPELPAREQVIDGAWRLPRVGLSAVPGGVSRDGRTVVLVDAATTDDWADLATTRFAILDRTLLKAPRFVTLTGAFEFDALSPDGSRLYVAEHIAGSLRDRYQVRVIDTASGRLGDEIIVDKRNLDEAMAGRPVDQAITTAGVVLTLYRGVEHPFIHALQSVEAWAVCIDLPARGLEDEAAATDWGVVLLPDGRAAVAVNATLGIAAQIHPTELTLQRTVDFDPTARTAITLAKFGHGETGPVDRRVVAAPASDVVYAAGPGGIIRLSTDELAVTGRWLAGEAVDAIALTPDGQGLFALVHAGGRIAQLDPATGAVLGWLDGDGYDRLVAIRPGDLARLSLVSHTALTISGLTGPDKLRLPEVPG